MDLTKSHECNEWKMVKVRGNIFWSYQCPSCKKIQDYAEFNFCPNCGVQFDK